MLKVTVYTGREDRPHGLDHYYYIQAMHDGERIYEDYFMGIKAASKYLLQNLLVLLPEFPEFEFENTRPEKTLHDWTVTTSLSDEEVTELSDLLNSKELLFEVGRDLHYNKKLF